MKQLQGKNQAAPTWAGLPGRNPLALSIFLLVVAAGMVATFLITPKYEATMSILVSRDRIDPQITSTDKTAEITQTTISEEEFNSELELFKSLDVITNVVRELDLVNDQNPKQDTWLGERRGQIKASIYELAGSKKGKIEPSDPAFDFAVENVVNRVAYNLDVVPTKKSRVIKVTYTDTDPQRAKKTLEAVYQKFVELHVELNEKPEAAKVFNEQTGKFNQRLNDATNNLKNFDTQNGVIGADISTQQGLLQKQLSDTQTQANATRTEIGETVKRVSSLQSKIAAEPEQIQTGYVSKYVPALDKMKDELVQLQQQRTQLLQKYQPNSRFVRDNQERIDQLKRTLAAETANPPQERSFALNDLRRHLEAELHTAQTSLVSLREREKTLTAQASKLASEVTNLNTRSIERTSLERKRSVNEEAYLLYEKKARENEVGQVLNKVRIMNFAVVDPPRTDGEQKNPKPLLNFLILAGVGAMAGFAGAVFYEKLSDGGSDRDLIISPDDIETRLSIPVLASISQVPVSRYGGVRPARRIRTLPSAFNDSRDDNPRFRI